LIAKEENKNEIKFLFEKSTTTTQTHTHTQKQKTFSYLNKVFSVKIAHNVITKEEVVVTKIMHLTLTSMTKEKKQLGREKRSST